MGFGGKGWGEVTVDVGFFEWEGGRRGRCLGGCSFCGLEKGLGLRRSEDMVIKGSY